MGMKKAAALGLGLAFATAGCARETSIKGPGAGPTPAAFEAARARCGVTVVETDAVKRCMSAQGWAFRHPWE